MKIWQKWTKENLPSVGEKVLIVYKSGFHGATDFFYSDYQKQQHIKGMEYYEKNPKKYDLGPIGNIIQEVSLSDPITYWMPFPKLPDQD